MKHKTIQQLWTKYQQHCVAADAGATQVKETRQAYFSGFFTLLLIVERFADADVSEDRFVQMLTTYSEEMKTQVSLFSGGRV